MPINLYLDILRYIRAVSHNVSAYFINLYPLARQSLNVTFQALSLYFRFIATALHPLLTLTLYLYHVLTPPIASLLRNFLIALTLQPRRVVMFELAFLAIISLSIWMERRYAFLHRTYSVYIRNRRRVVLQYRRLQIHVRAKSKLAASALPHFIFAVVASLFHASLARFLIPLVRGPGLVIIACVRPAFRTIYLLYAIDVAPMADRPSSPTSTSASTSTPTTTIVSPSPTRALNFTSASESISSSGNSLDATASANVVRASSSNVPRGSDETKSDSMRLRRKSRATPASEQGPASSMDRHELDVDENASVSETPTNLTASARRVRIDDTPRCVDSRPSISSTPLSRLRRVRELLSISAPGTRSKPEPSTPVTPKTSTSRLTEVYGAMDSATRFKEERTLLTFWVAFGLVWAVRSITWYLCPSMLESFMTMVDTWMFYLFIWAQVSLTNGARFGYALFTAFLRRRGLVSSSAKKKGSHALTGLSNETANETVHQLGIVMRLLTSLRIFDAIKSGRIWRALTDSGAVAGVAVMFLAVPRIVTFLATILIGTALPAINTAITLENSIDNESNSVADGDDDSDGPDLELQRHNWLAYWSVFSLLDAIYAVGAEKFGWLPLWYHIKMAIILWLLLPRFRGTVIMLDHLMTHVGLLLSTVRKQTVTPRKRKIR